MFVFGFWGKTVTKNLFLIFLCWGIVSISCIGEARCLLGEAVQQKQGLKASLPVYQDCALIENDDDAQYFLASLYQRGGDGVSPSTGKALLFYHLSAENGNARSQTELAKLLLKLDETSQGRQEIQSYLRKIQTALGQNESNPFKGELLHPYTLLLLAQENGKQKWYYPTKMTTSTEATALLKNYKVDPQKRAQALRDASSWKRKKMLEAAKEVFSPQEYQVFYQSIYPKEGRSDPFTRSQELEKLKKQIYQKYFDTQR